jgi:uncharacterized membrane protein
VKFAGQALQRILGSRIGQAMTGAATRQAAKESIPGAVLTAGFTALAGGGLGPSLLTGGLDIGLSTAGSRLAGKVTPAMLSKITGKRMANVIAGAEPGKMSTLQHVAMGAGSVGAALATAPMIAGQQIANLSQQDLQQLMSEPVVMDQTLTAEQQLLQRDLINQLQAQSLSPGTMFQMQGIESTLGRGMSVAPQIDPYGIMRGGALG